MNLEKGVYMLRRLQNISGASSRIQFVDGLRGISVLLVVLGHAFSSVDHFPLPIAFLFDADLGVRTFLVISGFVISSLLIVERAERGSIHLRGFFLKRLTKLVPTLYLYLLFALGLNALAPGYSPVKAPFGICSLKEFAVASLFLTQLVDHRCALTYHTWSLSLEEIFYLSWAPLFAFLKIEFGRPRNLLLLIAAAPILRIYMVYAPAIPWFRGLVPLQLKLFTFADSIGAGCLGAILLHCHRSKVERFAQRIGARGALLSAIVFYLSTLPLYQYPNLIRLHRYAAFFVPTVQGFVVTLFILFSAVSALPLSIEQLVTSRPLLFFGRISYSLYLWQQAFLLPLPLSSLNLMAVNCLRIPLAIAVSACSFLAVEDFFTRWLRARFKIASSSLISQQGKAPGIRIAA